MKKAFKTALAVLCTALVVSLTGCQKEPEDLIVGTWTETEVTYTLTQGGSTDTYSMLDPGETVDMTFNKDKTYSTVYHANEGDATETGTWSISGTKLTFLADNDELDMGPQTYNIDNIDKKNMILSQTESGEDEDGPFTATFVTKLSKK